MIATLMKAGRPAEDVLSSVNEIRPFSVIISQHNEDNAPIFSRARWKHITVVICNHHHWIQGRQQTQARPPLFFIMWTIHYIN